jgi:hypothetical protein
MVMLADLDDPPQSRRRGLTIGILLAVPLSGFGAAFALPHLHAAIVTSSAEFDARLRLEDGYMQGVCSEPTFSEPRDLELCSCVLAVDVPSLDCRGPFMTWSLERQAEQCDAADMRDTALAFCACVGELTRLSEAAKVAEDPVEVRRISQNYQRCAELADAPYLPDLDALVEASR